MGNLGELLPMWNRPVRSLDLFIVISADQKEPFQGAGSMGKVSVASTGTFCRRNRPIMGVLFGSTRRSPQQYRYVDGKFTPQYNRKLEITGKATNTYLLCVLKKVIQ